MVVLVVLLLEALATGHIECPPVHVLREIPISRIVLPEDNAMYQTSRQSINERFNSTFPCAILYCASTKEVASALQFTHHFKLPFAARSGGHSYEGFCLSSG